MYDDLLVKVILQEREQEIRRARLIAAAERARAQARKRRARQVAYSRTHERRPSERKAA